MFGVALLTRYGDGMFLRCLPAVVGLRMTSVAGDRSALHRIGNNEIDRHARHSDERQKDDDTDLGYAKCFHFQGDLGCAPFAVTEVRAEKGKVPAGPCP